MESIRKIEVNGYEFQIKCTRVSEKVITIDDYLLAKEICNKYEKLNNSRKNNNTLITDYPFSVRVKNVLNYVKKDFKLETISDLKDVIEKQGKQYFMRFRNFGLKGWDEIYAAINI